MRRTLAACAILSLCACTSREMTAPAVRPQDRSATIFPGSEVIYLGSLGGSFTYPSALNAAGQVVGFADAGFLRFTYHAFLWQNGAIRDLGGLPGPLPNDSKAYHINDAGQVVGSAFLPNGDERAVLWQDGTIGELGTLGGRTSYALAVNAGGQVVGSARLPDGIEHAFFWESGTMHDLGTLPGGMVSGASQINTMGHVVGYSMTASLMAHAVVWRDGIIQDLGTLGGPNSFGRAINDAGQVSGSSQTAAGNYHAFLWQDGRMQDLGTLPPPFDAYSFASGISPSGEVIGNSGGNIAFLWSAADGMENLTSATGLDGVTGIIGRTVVGAEPGGKGTLVRLRSHP